ncbi:hypothetical protein [Arthrobacter sp. H14-L1]|uniref:hypothetical protein n=1 Tax=Arthrobacter sp. H14-L1 TaxID=2996697 RepID=UPI0022707041|nr:hypothetical protein [Arthrobacter sp. H14-L1]MCY0905423.1 hypothetical protein [Arthrobacter sp. H14-L1]
MTVSSFTLSRREISSQVRALGNPHAVQTGDFVVKTLVPVADDAVAPDDGASPLPPS